MKTRHSLESQGCRFFCLPIMRVYSLVNFANSRSHVSRTREEIAGLRSSSKSPGRLSKRASRTSVAETLGVSFPANRLMIWNGFRPSSMSTLISSLHPPTKTVLSGANPMALSMLSIAMSHDELSLSKSGKGTMLSSDSGKTFRRKDTRSA